MKKTAGSMLLVMVTTLGLGACSGGDGNGTPFCDKARELTKALGRKAELSSGDAVRAALSYKFMADNLPKDLTDVTKKDVEDLSAFFQAQSTGGDLASLEGQVDFEKIPATSRKIQAYNEKHCDIKYKK